MPFNGSVNEVKLYLSQHLGAPCIPVVKKGDRVAKGQVVGEIPEGKLGAKVHSSIDGVVAEINNEYIIIKK